MKDIRFLTFLVVLSTLVLSACGATLATPEVMSGSVEPIPVAFIGTIDSIAGDQWVINGTTVTVEPAVVRDGPFSVGNQVKLEGMIQPDGSLQISRVEVPSPQDAANLPQFGNANANESISTPNVNESNVNEGNINDANINDGGLDTSNSNDVNSNASNSNDENGNSSNFNDNNSNSSDSNDDNSNSSNMNDDNSNDDNGNDANSNDDDDDNSNSDNGNDDDDNSGGGNDNGGGNNDNGDDDDDNGNGG